jgi:pilus assembly protein Flp/PilA
MIGFLIEWVKDNVKRQEGQAMAEYGLILALVAVVCIVVLGLLGTGISGKLQAIVDKLK